MTLDNILEEIKKAEKIVLLVHENPDGDAVGSAMAMHLALQQLGKEADIIIPDYPKCFEFLPSMDLVKAESDIANYELAISLDCATKKLLKDWVKYFDDAKTRIVIDHHGSNSMYGDLNFVDPKSPACAQLLVVIFNYFGIEITKEIGTCLLTGIITDTGGFAYSGVTEETFEFTARLVEKGINVSKIYQKVFSAMTVSRFKLNRIAMNRLELLEDGKIAFTYITKKDELDVDAQSGDYEGIVAQGRNIEGVEVSVFLRETENDIIKVSLRSKDYVNVSEVCVAFGGGGHPRAAGCNIQGTIESAKKQILSKIKEVI